MSRIVDALRTTTAHTSYSAIPTQRPMFTLETSSRSQRKAATLVSAASLLFALTTLCVHTLTNRYQHHSSAQLLAFIGTSQTFLAITSCLLVYKVHPFRLHNGWKALCWTSICGLAQSLSYLMYYSAVSRTSMGVASALFATNCVVAAAVDIWMRGDRVSGETRKLLWICLAGTVLALLPPSPLLVLVKGIPAGRMLALMASLGMATAHIVGNSRVDGNEHPMVCAVYCGPISGIVGALASLGAGDVWRIPGTGAMEIAGLLAVVGSAAFASQVLMAKGIARHSGNRAVALAGNVNVVACFALDAALFSSTPSVLGAAGAALILYSAVSLDM